MYEREGLFNSKPLIIKITIVQHNEKFYVFDKSFRPDMADTFLKDFRSEQDQLIDSFNYLD
jgi:hypothetical protein